MQTHKKYIQWWLWTGAALIFLMVIIGGVTRLTDSGLSMPNWSLIMGAIPPMNESEWVAVFNQYKQFPQYQQLNVGMTLGEFKGIFFWEYLHRLVGRVIGIVFLIPFAIFWVRGYFTPKIFRRILILFALGALQAAMGWFMVKSGLIDVPYVSHYRLALHLLLAFLLIGCCIWFALDMKKRSIKKKSSRSVELKKWALAVGAFFFVQITWGAFTAGLNAGYIYNTFPLMNGEWIPLEAWVIQPVFMNLLENPATVQWTHRIFGTLLGMLIVGLWVRTRSADVSPALKLKAHLLLGLMALQYLLGVLTLLFYVPIALGVIHQAGAMLVWIGWLIFYHDLKKTY